MNKQKWIVLIALVVVVAVLATVYVVTRPRGNDEIKNFTVTIVHKEGEPKVLKCTSDAEMVGDYLQAEGIVKGEMGTYGLYIHEVDGERAVYEECGAFWSFYVDGQQSITGIDQTVLEDGKNYELRYEVYSDDFFG